MKPGETTLHWIHFGVAASAVIASVGGFLPLPFGIGIALATVAGTAKNVLLKKQTDQESTMK